jgi:4,5-DOPA dioxygenase extradiol
MNAIEENVFSRTWQSVGHTLPRPQAILSISAHWETIGSQVTASPQPRTIHDFYGFPPELNAMLYPAPGSPMLAHLLQQLVTLTPIKLDTHWGLDHGTWSVLSRLFPRADIPVLQLSLDSTKSPSYHYALGQALAPLRRRGVMIVGSGNIVHNLGMVCYEDRAFDWACEFDSLIHQAVLSRDHQTIVDYDKLGRNAKLSVPTNEHYLPLLYILALQEPDETPVFFNEQVTLCSLGMRSLRFG